MSDIIYIIDTFGKVLANNPARLLPFLASACAATMIIAIISDTLLRQRLAQGKRTATSPSKNAGQQMPVES